MSNTTPCDKVIAITGASSGIGKETAKQLVDKGYKVALLARSEDKLNELVNDLGEDNARAICQTAFDLGITHFDFANNYGPPAGTAETNAGKILKEDFHAHRDELIISSKAGYHMWEGP